MSDIAHLDTTALDTAAKFFRTMRKAGADFTGPMQSVAKRRNLVEYLTMGCPKVKENGELETFTRSDRARRILSNDFITPEEVMSAHSGVVYTDEQIAELMATLPSDETLTWLWDNNYALMPTPPQPLTIIGVRKLRKELFCTEEKAWYDDHDFAKNERVGTGWLAIRKEPVPSSRSKAWEEQKSLLLTQVERVPTAAESAWFITTYAAVRNIRLFPNVYVRTSSVAAVGYRVRLGSFGHDGLRVDYGWGAFWHGGLGLVSARKF